MMNDPASETRPGATPSGGSGDPLKVTASAGSDGLSAFDEGGFTPGTLLLGRYRIVGLIGRGGMGEVYRAQDLRLGQSVALKFLPESVHRDPSRLERFLNEVRIARQISHPSVCRVYDVGDVDGRHFISMEFVDGEDLASLLRRIGRLPPDKGVETARQICAGLAAAHDRGVLHRDLKPANIMIDGRGHARLADFGLAAAGDDRRKGGEVAGTPAYMAPEQIEGREISTRTDVYALGLVLHELFTGKRVFEEASLHDLREAHRKRSATPSTLSPSSLDLDPAIERVIARCLEPDPQKRPPSALAVSAALPGGDPLAAALAAGETPSPELVAGAGSVGALRPVVAWSLLAAFVLSLVVCAWFAHRVRFYRLAPAMRSPEVLAGRAEDLLDRLGVGGLRADTRYGWTLNRRVVAYVREHEQTADRWERLATADAPGVEFWYRQSSAPLIPLDTAGDVDVDDPPPQTSGVATLVFTPRGRLVSFHVPPRSEDAGLAQSATDTDWSPLFAAAGIDPSGLTPAEPMQPPHGIYDARAAWTGAYPNRPDWPLRIEAESYRSRPVYFEVRGPWTSASLDVSGGPFAAARQAVQISLILSVLVLGLWQARRNLRAGRADTRSAMVIGFCAGAPYLVAGLLIRHHTADMDAEWERFIVLLGLALFWGVVLWLVYLAIEPYVRRRWPEALISWTRLLSGRINDPLVGRDELIGLVGGIAIYLANDTASALPEWLGSPPISPTDATGQLDDALGPTSAFLGRLVYIPMRVLSESLLVVFLFLAGLAVFRNRWVAYAVLVAEFIALGVNREAIVFSSLGIAAYVTMFVFLISRFGLLSYVATIFAWYTINDLPLTLDTSAWFVGRSTVVAAMLLGVGVWSFYTALAGRPAFGTASE